MWGPCSEKCVGAPLPPMPSSRGSKVKWPIHLTWINDPRPFLGVLCIHFIIKYRIDKDLDNKLDFLIEFYYAWAFKG